MSEDEPATITGADMARLIGLLPSELQQQGRESGRRPKVIVAPDEPHQDSWRAMCWDCDEVASGVSWEVANIASHRHNGERHAGQGEVDGLLLSLPYTPGPEGTAITDAWTKYNRAHELVLSLIDKCHEWSGTVPLELRQSVTDDGWQRWSLPAYSYAILLRFTLLLGEAIHQLRSSLDVAIYALFPGKRTAFPVALSESVWPKERKSAQGVPTPVFKVVERWQPFNRSPGDISGDPLAQINKLWNTDKHRVIAASLGVLTGYQVGLTTDPPNAPTEHRALLPEPVTQINEDVLLLEARATGAPAIMEAALDDLHVRVMFAVGDSLKKALAAADLPRLVLHVRALLHEIDTAALRHASGAV